MAPADFAAIVDRIVNGLAAALRERIRRQPLRTLVVSNIASLLIALQLASRHFGGLRALVVRAFLRAARGTPAMRGQLVRMKAQVREKIERMVVKNIGAPTLALPAEGVPEAQLSARLREWSGAESSWRQGRVSGTVYSGEDELTRLQAEVFQLYAVSNPMHPDVFPSVRKMEAEVVAMVLRLFHAPAAGCGTMTSCGTESILLACKAYRDHARETRGVLEPEMVVPTTAHAAFLKAGHYLGIKVVRVPVDPRSFRADVAAMGRAITRNTVLVGASAPSFAQGVIDPIAPIAALARAAGVGLHVDCCAGSFLLAMMDDLGYDVPPFDFRVEGVSSLSCDTHKYGFAPKGSAVILYANQTLRHHQYYIAADWTGGIYATPTMCGSRPGALIAATWATMLRLGVSGYLAAFEKVLNATRLIEEGVRAIEGLALFGSVDTSIVCFGPAAHLNILAVGDAMNARGWSLNTLQTPPCLHICVCLPHAAPGVAERFVDDLRQAVDEVASVPNGTYDDGTGAIYGAAGGAVRDSSIVEEVACTFIDALYKV